MVLYSGIVVNISFLAFRFYDIGDIVQSLIPVYRIRAAKNRSLRGKVTAQATIEGEKMDLRDQIKALMPDLINGKTYEQLVEWTKARDQKMGAHYVNGVKLPWFVPRSNFEALETFEVRDDDVFVVSFPRSGTHWTVETLQLILNEGNDDIIDRSLISTDLEITLVPDLSSVESAVPGYKRHEAVKSPRVIQTHCRESLLPPQVWTKQAKVVYVARNPKDVLISSFFIVQCSELLSVPSLDEWLWLFNFDELPFGSWSDHVLDFWKLKDDPKVLFIKYEDLHKDHKGSVVKLAQHIAKDLKDDVIDSIAERATFGGMLKTYQKLQEVHGEEGVHMTHLFGDKSTPFLRKGKVGDWKNYLTVAQSAIFDKVYDMKMRGTGLDFDFDL